MGAQGMADNENQDLGHDSAVKSPGGRSQKRKVAKRPAFRPLPPWKVLLHNDDKNEFEDVIKIVRRLTPLSEQDATMRTLEAHETGVALLLMTHRERAELYVDQFATFGLTATAEADA